MSPFFTDCTFVHYQIYTNAGRLSIPPAHFLKNISRGRASDPAGSCAPHPATALPQRVLVALVPLHELGDAVDVGEVANHVAVVEHLDGLALRDGAGKEHRAHVGAFPGQGRGRALAA